MGQEKGGESHMISKGKARMILLAMVPRTEGSWSYLEFGSATPSSAGPTSAHREPVAVVKVTRVNQQKVAAPTCSSVLQMGDKGKEVAPISREASFRIIGAKVTSEPTLSTRCFN